jgi:hypothetical protein
MAGLATKAALLELDVLNDKKAKKEINLPDYSRTLVDLQKRVAGMNAETAVYNKRAMAIKLARVNITAISYTMGSTALNLAGRAISIKLMTTLEGGIGKLDCPATIGAEWSKMMQGQLAVLNLHLNVVKQQTSYKILWNGWRHLDRLVMKNNAMVDGAEIKASGMAFKEPEVFAVINGQLQGKIREDDERAFMRMVDKMTFIHHSMDIKIAQWWLGVWSWYLGITQKFFESRILSDPSCSASKEQAAHMKELEAASNAAEDAEHPTEDEE